MPAKRRKRTRRTVKIPKEYLEVIGPGESLFSPLYQFENGLRLAVDKLLTAFYSQDWWEIKLKNDLIKVYEYAEDKMEKRKRLPSVAKPQGVEPLPIHFITLGHLEEIVKKYGSDCIPALFPSMDFFLGHMHAIKEVRNLFSHMYPCINNNDVRLAKREIKTLSEHINEKL